MRKIIEFMIKLQCVKEYREVYHNKKEKGYYIKDVNEHDSG